MRLLMKKKKQQQQISMINFHDCKYANGFFMKKKIRK